jgi:hypothetical protein
MGELFDQMMAEWIEKASETYAKLAADERFINGEVLVASFEKAAELYKNRKSTDDIKAVFEKANELAAALSILDRLEEGQTLVYEPKLSKTKKSIDYLVRDAEAKPYLWIDVKTVAPEWVDTDAEWERFEGIRGKLHGATAPGGQTDVEQTKFGARVKRSQMTAYSA